jgi:hypothetical protein
MSTILSSSRCPIIVASDFTRHGAFAGEVRTTPSPRIMTLFYSVDDAAYAKFVLERYGDDFEPVRVSGERNVYEDGGEDCSPDTFLFVKKTVLSALLASTVNSPERRSSRTQTRLRITERTWIDLDLADGLVVNHKGIVHYDPECTVVVANDMDWCYLHYISAGTKIAMMDLSI